MSVSCAIMIYHGDILSEALPALPPNNYGAIMTWNPTYRQLSLLRNGDGKLPFSICLFHAIWSLIKKHPRDKQMNFKEDQLKLPHIMLSPMPQARKPKNITFFLSLLNFSWIFFNEIHSMYSVRMHLFKMTVKDDPKPVYLKLYGKRSGWPHFSYNLSLWKKNQTECL